MLKHHDSSEFFNSGSITQIYKICFVTLVTLKNDFAGRSFKLIREPEQKFKAFI